MSTIDNLPIDLSTYAKELPLDDCWFVVMLCMQRSADEIERLRARVSFLELGSHRSAVNCSDKTVELTLEAQRALEDRYG